MSSLRVPPTRIGRAIVLSLALHLCGLMLLNARLGRTAADPREAAQNAPVFHITTIVRRTPAPARVSVATAPVVPRPAPAMALPSPHRPPSPAPVRWPRPAAAVKPSVILTLAPARRPPATPTPASAVVLRVAIVASPTPDPAPPDTPPATPAATPGPSPTAGATPASGTFGGLFSQNYPPALPAPSIVESIRERLGVHGVIRIDVDENGHAAGVEFSGPQLDVAAAQEVRAQLLGLTYVPADCNGLHCEGVLKITY